MSLSHDVQSQILESIDPINIIGDLRIELASLDQWYPALFGNEDYLSLMGELIAIEAERNRLDLGVVESFYVRLISFLKTAQLDNNVIRFGSRPEKSKPALDGFLPVTFSDFVTKISLEKQAMEYVEDGVEAAAHAIILGELPYGLTAVTPRFRNAVKAVVMSEIQGTVAGEALEVISEEYLLSVLELDEEEIVEQLMDEYTFAVGLAILAVRRELDGVLKVSTRTHVEPNANSITREEVEGMRETDPLAYNLLRTIIYSKPESPRSTRLKLAARVARVMAFDS